MINAIEIKYERGRLVESVHEGLILVYMIQI